MLVRLLPEGLPEDGDIPREADFLHHGVPPNYPKQLILANDFAMVFKQRQKDVKRLGSQGDPLTAPQKEPPGRIHLVLAKPVKPRPCRLVQHCQNL